MFHYHHILLCYDPNFKPYLKVASVISDSGIQLFISSLMHYGHTRLAQKQYLYYTRYCFIYGNLSLLKPSTKMML